MTVARTTEQLRVWPVCVEFSGMQIFVDIIYSKQRYCIFNT